VERIAVETTAVVVLADGASTADMSNNRGHLLEVFVAKLLATQGYEQPRTENLNVTAEGVEIDIAATHRLTKERAICECKAYSSNIRVGPLTSFVGKYALELADDPTCKGFFIGLPRLTPEAREKADDAERKLAGFRYLGSFEVCDLLASAGLLPSLDDGPTLKADPTLVISEHGLALAASELDPDSRRALRWVVWARAGRPPAPLLALVERNLASGLPVAALGADAPVVPVRVAGPVTIVPVQGSSSDFEYQLPAAPEFFVGRKEVVADVARQIINRSTGGCVVINAKSGWGKSSLSLRLKKEVEKAGGVALVVDTRTADRPEFATLALERLVRTAVDKKLIVLPEGAAFSSVQSIVETLRQSTWRRAGRPLLIGFDQFENVFRDPEITREFRDLALLVRDSNVPLTATFSWKTDMVGWTEDHPYRLRDEIREAATVIVLEPFGAREVETLLRRLEKAVDEKLNRELRQRLREYSQGLPWLFKKFAGHIITEVKSGTTQEQLVKQSLNVQVLFESDLARLTPAEQEALHTIARAAPVPISDVDESIGSAVLESLLHQRLIVQVGERLDIYWDTFRDFLITGRVAIEDSYVIRYAPLGAGRLLRVVMGAGGEVSVPEAASALDTTATVVFNYARDLRLFGVLSAEANKVVIESAIAAAPDPEESIRSRVAIALRRHKMHSLAMELLAASGGQLTLKEFAESLPAEFPTVEAKADSWFTYARSFCQWMEYAGIIELNRDRLSRRGEHSPPPSTRLLSGAVPIRVRSAFPGSNAGPALTTLQHLAAPTEFDRPPERAFRAALRDLTLLGAIELDAGERVTLVDPELAPGGVVNVVRLALVVSEQRGMHEAFDRLREDPSCSPKQLGEYQRAALGADWAPATTASAGKFIRSWARACGIATRLKPTGTKPVASTDAPLGGLFAVPSDE
jgi:hypothetical protein